MAPPIDQTESSVSMMRWRLIGDVTAVGPDGQSVTLGHRQRTVLALLLVHANASLSVVELADALWGETQPKTARKSVQRFIADIRGVLGADAGRLATTSAGYRLEVRPGELDVDRARNALEQGRNQLRSKRPRAALKVLEAGIAELQGVPLEGIRSDVLDRDAIGPLTELATNLRAARFEAALALGRHAEISDDLHRFALTNPASEQAWALYMLGLYRSGRQQEALEAGEQLRQRLADDYGITPSPLIAKLTHQILNHADELQLVVSEPVTAPPTPPVAQPSQTALPAQLARAITGPLLGRTAFTAHGQDMVDRLGRGESGVTLIAGEPGVGKTRLTAEIASSAARSGSTVVYGRCDEDTALALGAWSEILRQLLRAETATFDRCVQGPIRESLSTIVPELAVQAPVETAIDDGTSELRRASLFQAITHVLQECGTDRPLTLVLDDLQWADASSLQLLRHVVRFVTAPVWIIATYRDSELAADHLLRDVIATLLREPHVHAKPLDGIDASGIQELVQVLVPEVNEARLPEFAQALQRETRGNPFFAAEIVRNMIEASPDERTLRLNEPGDGAREIPDTVRQVIRQRVARLGERTASALRSASVFGREFSLGELARVLDAPTNDVLEMLEAGLNAQVVSELDAQPDRFAFAHDLMHHSLYGDLSASRRRRLHGQIAQTITERSRSMLKQADAHGDPTPYVEQVTSRASEIASHFLAALDGNLAPQTIEAVMYAAEVAAQRHAPAEAASLYARALDVLDDAAFVAGLDPSVDLQELRLQMLVRRGVELRNAGDANYRQALLDAGRAAHELGDIEAEVEAALANTRGLQTNVWEVDVDRVDQLRKAAAGLGEEESARRANLLASLASEQWAEEDREASQQLRAESIALARRVNDRETLANTLARAARARNAGTSASEFRDLASEMRSMIPESNGFDPYLVINVLRTIQNQALRDADPALLYEMADAIRALTDRTQLPICHRANMLSDVLIAGLHGEAEKYLRLAERALTLSLEMGDPESFIAYEGHYFLGMNMLGRTNEILPMVAQVSADRGEVDLYAAIAALAHCVTGDAAPAKPLIDQALARGFVPGLDDYTIQGLQLWADSAAGTNHLDACAALYPLLAPHGNRLSGHVVNVTQPVDLSLGRLCRVLGRYDDSLAHFDVSDRICRDFSAVWMQGMTDVSRAATLLARNGPGDADAAHQLLEAATATATKNNLNSVIQQAERVTPKI